MVLLMLVLVLIPKLPQRLPPLPDSSGFDRVLCDVPCSGDGTMRKTRAR